MSSPRTPDTLHELTRKHQRRVEPGEIATHWGSQNFQPHVPSSGFGLRSAGHGESVEANFRSSLKTGLAVYKDSVSEEVYASIKREPLGTSYNRGHRLPEVTLRPDYRFGKATVLDRPAKDVINPKPVEPDNEEALDLYRKSHMSTRGGEAFSRKYDWPPMVDDAANFRFGQVPMKDSSNQGAGVKSALAEDSCAEALAVPNTIVLNEATVHHREVVGDKLGKVRSTNQCGQRALPPSHVFGMAGTKDPIGAGELVYRSYPMAEQLPDSDLGRCVLQGRRNFVTREPFGVPSVRMDRVAPPREKRSVASCTNFGDDSCAVSLLSPGRFNNLGVEDLDFHRLRAEPELRSIFEGAGLGGLSPETLHAASCSCGTEDALAGSPVASVQALMHACVDWSAARSSAPALPPGG